MVRISTIVQTKAMMIGRPKMMTAVIRNLFILLLLTSSQFSLSETAFEDVLSDAQKGNADSQYDIGKKYSKGEVIQQDFKQAFYWVNKAAEQGHPKAQNKLGFFYQKGQGVPQDYQKAIDWYKKSADQGFVDAQYNIGLAYAKGEIAPQDYKQAFYWFSKAAQQGDTTAQLNMGLMFLEGQGVPQSYKHAFVFCSLAADSDSPITGENGELITYGGVPAALDCRDVSADRLTPDAIEKSLQEVAELKQSIKAHKISYDEGNNAQIITPEVTANTHNSTDHINTNQGLAAENAPPSLTQTDSTSMDVESTQAAPTESVSTEVAPDTGAPCSADNMIKLTELMFVKGCVKSVTSSAEMLKIINAAKDIKKCGIAQRLYAHRGQAGDVKIATAYAHEYDPKFHQPVVFHPILTQGFHPKLTHPLVLQYS
jgi:TPR repeat protein